MPTQRDRTRFVRTVGRSFAIFVAVSLIATACGSDGDGDDETLTPIESSEPGDDTTEPSDGGAEETDPGSGSESGQPEEGAPTEAITQLQIDLAELEFYEGEITGEYDAATEEAVMAFQEFAGISADGIVGPQTAAAIDVALGRPGGSVSSLQNALTALCYYTGEIDGQYGPMTTEAVSAFQADAGVDVDGFYGPATAEALVAAWPSRPDSCPGGGGEDPADPEDPTEPGGAAITAIVDGTATTFGTNVSCVLGPDDSGSVLGTADDGSTLSITLDGTASRVIISEPAGPVDAPVTMVSNDATTLTVQAAPPVTEVLVALSACTSNEESTPEAPVDDDPGTLNAVTATVSGISTAFNNNVACSLGPDDSGSVQASADDGSTISATLDGTASRVVIDGPAGPVDAEVTSVSNDQAILTIEAAPPATEVLVTLEFCS